MLKRIYIKRGKEVAVTSHSDVRLLSEIRDLIKKQLFLMRFINTRFVSRLFWFYLFSTRVIY